MPSLSADLMDLPRADRLARLQREPDPGRSLADLCESVKQLVLTDLGRALEMSESIRELAEAIGAAGGRSRALAARAHVLAYANRFEESLALAEQAESVAREGGAPFEAAAALLISVQARARLGRLEDAAAAATEAGNGFQALGEAVWAAKARVNAGVLARMKDDPETALAHFAAARPAFAGQPGVLAQVESNAAEAMLDLNRFGEAEAAFRRALAGMEESGNRRAAAIVEGNLADLLNRQGRGAEALRHFENALRAFEGDSAAGDRARLNIERAEALATIGLLDDARRTYEQTLLTLDNAGMAWESARARMGLGRVLLGLGRWADAAAALRDAAGRCEALAHAAGALRSLALLARVPHEHRGVPDLRRRLDAGLAAVAGRGADTAEGLAALASLLEEDHRADAADASLSRAIDLAREADLRPVLADMLHARGRLRAGRGDPGARCDLAEAMDLVDRLRGVLPADRFRAALQGARAALYEDAAAAALEGGGADGEEAAFQAAERSRSRSLLELMEREISLQERDGAGSEGRGDSALFTELRAWRGELNALYSRLGLGAREGVAATRTWSARAAEAENRIGEIESHLAATRPYAEAYRLPLGLDDVRGALAPGEALIAYFAVHGRLLAFVVRADRPLRVVRLGAGAGLPALLDGWNLQVGRARARGLDSADERMARAARVALGSLYDALLRPLERSLEGATALTICPTGPLQPVPFHALWDGGRFAVERWTLSRTLSASLLASLPRPTPDGTPLVVGVHDEAAPWIADEAADVAAVLPRAAVLLDRDATAARFAAAAHAAPLIHLATHCTRTPGSPLSARLRLADRWLTVRDLYGLKLHGSVVVLTGCETAQGESMAGDESFGLVRGFLGAGASAVVASLWPVHDAGARAFVSMMYRGWGPGKSLAAALAGAARSMILAGSHPALWAPFIHVGCCGEDRESNP